MTTPSAPLTFTRGPAMANRMMLAPLTNLQSHPDGTLSDDEIRWLTMRAQGGMGLVMTAAAHVQRQGQGFPGQLGIWSDDPLPRLTQLADAIRACSACDLGARRRHAVPGMGDPAPDWLIVGEAPGEEEDRQGLPFVGRAGQLLDRMLAAMGLDRQHKVHIANVIKCRPPHNRNPDPVEIAQCEPWLLRQVELLQPRIIVALGRFAAHTLLAHSPAFTSPEALRQLPLGKLRGRVHEVEIAGRRLPLVVSYHPAYLLRSPGEKAKSWADLCLALDAFGRLPPRG